jgi:hypothetical protein
MVLVQSRVDTHHLSPPPVRANYLGLAPRDISRGSDRAIPVDIRPLGSAAVVLRLDPSMTRGAVQSSPRGDRR